MTENETDRPTRQAALAFGIETPRGMLRKLERELKRLSRATFEPQDVVDHSINCAMTAWHIVEWVWQLHFRRNQDALDALARAAGLQTPNGGGRYPPQWMADWICQCSPEIATCREIAIGSKHVILDPPPVRVADTDVSARPTQEFTLGTSVLGGGDVFDGRDLPPTQYLPKVRGNDGTTHNAIQVFDAAVLFWRQFFDDYGIN